MAQVKHLTDVVAISAGGCHSLAVRGDGTVWAWGQNTSQCLGTGEDWDQNALTPVPVRTYTRIVERKPFEDAKSFRLDPFKLLD